MSGRLRVQEIIVQAVADAYAEEGIPAPTAIEPGTRLFGGSEGLDSLGLVSLVIDIEQRLEQELGVVVALTDERAMSRRSSPFRSVQSLTDYICSLLAEERQNGGA